MGGRHTSTAGLTRLAVLCAVLFGLFSMHGAPASAAAGCHGAMVMPAPVNVSPPMGQAPMGHASAGDASVGRARIGQASIGHATVWHAPVVKDASTSTSAGSAERPGHRVAPVAAGPIGERCVSTPARERLPLAATGLLALLALVIQMGGERTGPGAALRAVRRGPPFDGRGLLLQMCVART